jgi:hypothetical protein
VSPSEFVASLVSSLAWPLTALAIVALFRAQLRSVLQQRSGRVRAGPFELEWERTVEGVRGDLPPGIVGKPSAASVVADLFSLVDRSPAAAVFEGHRRMREALLRRLGGKGIHGPQVDALGVGELARQARDLALITDQVVRVIDGLSELRNLAAHGPPGAVTPGAAREYLGLVQTVLFTVSTWIKPDPPDPP